MRTSSSQFHTIVDFMERNGDLSRPIDGTQGRITNIHNWVRLTKMLNSDPSGAVKSASKWRKVWSDLKNNTKKKAGRLAQQKNEIKINPSTGRVYKLKLNDVEQRVINIIGQSITTEIVDFPELNLNLDQEERSILQEDSNIIQEEANILQEERSHKQSSESNSQSSDSNSGSDNETKFEPIMDDWNQPGTSEPPPKKKFKPSIRRRWRPSYQSRKMHSQTEVPKPVLVSADSEWLSFQREVEKERIRLRKRELQQQGRWLDLFEQFLDLGNRVVDVMEKK